jgi:hypothetical protein
LNAAKRGFLYQRRIRLASDNKDRFSLLECFVDRQPRAVDHCNVSAIGGSARAWFEFNRS